jgi:hypothetical protein
MIKVYLRGRACIENVRGRGMVQGEFHFELFFTLSLFFHFSCHLLVLRLFPLLDDLEFLFGFWSSSYASWSLGFKIQTLCFLLSMYSSRGRLRNQVVSTLI